MLLSCVLTMTRTEQREREMHQLLITSFAQETGMLHEKSSQRGSNTPTILFICNILTGNALSIYHPVGGNLYHRLARLIPGRRFIENERNR
jgi:hypothetical protein